MAGGFDGFKFDGPRLDDFDLPRIGHAIGVGEDIIHGVMDTEAAGKSTDSRGRLKMLYEPHVAYRNSSGVVRDRLVKAGLAYPKWRRNYPKDSYPRLHKAMEISETVALLSASWGFPQILGENFALAGYDSIQAMVRDFQKDEDNQLEAMVRFIKNAGLDDELRVLEAKLRRGQRITPDDARPFVRGYNGSQYAKNDYHTTFARNLNKWAKIPDTPWQPGQDAGPLSEEPAHMEPNDYLYDGKFHPEVLAVQERLDALGYPEVGGFDGKWGSKTRAAVLAFRADVGLSVEPEIDDTLLAALMTAKPREVSAARKNATLDDLRNEGAKDVEAADSVDIVGKVAGGGGLLVAADRVLGKGEEYSGIFGRALELIEPVKSLIVDNMWLLLLGVGAFVVWKSGVLKRIRLEKHRTAKDVSE